MKLHQWLGKELVLLHILSHHQGHCSTSITVSNSQILSSYVPTHYVYRSCCCKLN
jgi:hypothetical protein